MGIALVPVFSTPGSPSVATAVALAAQATLCAILALVLPPRPSVGRYATRIALIALLGLLTAWPGYFLGPNGTIAAFLVIVLVVAGVFSPPGTRAAVGGWVIYGTVAGSQALVLILVVTRTIPDVSFTPVLLADRPTSTHLLGHLFVQVIYLASHLSGRAFARRYQALALKAEEASRADVIREALLAEARAQYRHALRIARGSGSRPTPEALPPPPTRIDRPAARGVEPDTVRIDSPSEAPDTIQSIPDSSRPAPARAPGPPPVVPPRTTAEELRSRAAWAEASRFRRRRVLGLTLGLCAGGAALLGVIAMNRTGLYVAWAGIAGIAVAIVVHNRSYALGPASWWAWTVGGVLSIGPAYSVGLHSAFSAIVAALFIFGELFRAPVRAAQLDKRHRVYVGTALAHAATFLLIMHGVLPDIGNVPVLLEDAERWQIYAQHLGVQVLYLAAFAAGRRIDRRNAELATRIEAAARRAAAQEATLAETQEALERVLDEETDAIFEGAEVGPYRVDALLGRGGMGDVYEAENVSTGERVALKLIRRERAADPLALRSFATEAEALSRVRSEHVARVLGASDADAELPFLAMELVKGRTLSEILAERGQLPLAEVAELVRDITRGLRDTHAAGVLHRDLKPRNVVQTPGGGWKLLDFGIAQIQHLVDPDRSEIAGTPGYMAPEQALGDPIDARADLYSLCLVVYRALTGRPAFIGDDPVRIAQSALTHPAPDPRWYVALPRDVERVLRVGLAADAENRFASATELAAAFEAACEGRLSPHHRARAEAILTRAPWTDPVHLHLPAEADEPSTHLPSP